jgi:hypothetical protein
MTDINVEEPRRSIWSLLGGAAAVVGLLIVVMLCASLGLASVVTCSGYTLIKLTYPILFGAAGVLLGGQVSLNAKGHLYGMPVVATVTGGIAAAVLGFGLAHLAQPKDCNPRHTITIKSWQTQEPILRPKYYTIVEYGQGVRAWIPNQQNGTNDYAFSFTGSKEIEIKFKIFEFLKDNEASKLLTTCVLKVHESDPEESSDQALYKLPRGREDFQLRFDPNYYKRIEAAVKSGNLDSIGSCLTAQAIAVDKPKNKPIKVPVTGPLYLKFAGGSLPISTAPIPEIMIANMKLAADPAAVAREINLERPVLDSPAPPVPISVIKQVPPATPNAPIAISVPETTAATASNCELPAATKTDIDAFLAGDDLNPQSRQEIYKRWAEGPHCYVWRTITSGKSSAPSKARAMRLLNYALKNIDNAYWQLSGKTRRDFQKIPAPLTAADLRVIFRLAHAEDDQIRGEAAAFIRYYPVDAFEVQFRTAVDQLNAMPLAQREKLATTAAFMYYNRIAEQLSGGGDKAKIQQVINQEFDRGQKWTADSNFSEDAAKAYRAMLLYARAAVDRWAIRSDGGVQDFATMLELLRQTEAAYPQRHTHIAQALAIVGGVGTAEALEAIKTSIAYPADTSLEDDPTVPEPPYRLFSGPGENYKRLPGRVDKKEARMLMRFGDWVLIHTKGKIGWITRAQSS